MNYLEIRNDGDILTVNDEYMCLYLRYSFRYDPPAITSSEFSVRSQTAMSMDNMDLKNPIVLICPDTYGAGVFTLMSSPLAPMHGVPDDAITPAPFSEPNLFLACLTARSGADIYVFDTQPSAALEKFGFEAFDESGRTVYHSQWLPIRPFFSKNVSGNPDTYPAPHAIYTGNIKVAAGYTQLVGSERIGNWGAYENRRAIFSTAEINKGSKSVGGMVHMWAPGWQKQTSHPINTPFGGVSNFLAVDVTGVPVPYGSPPPLVQSYSIDLGWPPLYFV